MGWQSTTAMSQNVFLLPSSPDSLFLHVLHPARSAKCWSAADEDCGVLDMIKLLPNPWPGLM